MESTHIFIYLLSLTCISQALTSVEVTKAKKDEAIYLRQMYTDMDRGIKNLVRENLKSVLRILEENSQQFNLSSECKGNAFKILSGLRDLKFWALNFIDATGKLNDGILSGNFYMYGNYDQCLNSSVLKRSGAVDFRGQYCLVSIATHLPKPELTPDMSERVALVKHLTQNLTEVIGFYAHKSELHRTNHAKIGLCVPSGCDTNDVEQLIKYVGKRILLNLTLEFCETEDSLIYFTPTRIVILFIYSFFILLVIISSVIEQYSIARKIKFERNFLLKAVLTWAPRFFFQILVNGFFSVDVFFFIGGFLNCYVRAKKNFTFFSLSSSFMIFTNRLMRIYPVYVVIILLNLLFNPRGPMAHDMKKNYWEPCKTQWWKNIIFINNFYDSGDQCLRHSWYLAADMQFFLVSLFTIPLLFRNPKIGVLVNLVIILLSTAFTSVRVWTEKLVPTFVIAMDLTQKEFEDWTKLYETPFPHASAYFGGVLLGYFITKKRGLTISKRTLVFGWIVASTMFLTMMFVSKRWNSGIPYTRLESALYISLSRLLYSWSVGWLIFCCVTGKGGFINYILSWKVWIPLNRLGLSAYLLSVILQLYYFGNLRTAQDGQHEIEIWSYFGDVTVTYLLTVPVVLLFESPFIALEKMIFHKKENTSELKGSEMKGIEIVKNENETKSDKDKSSINI